MDINERYSEIVDKDKREIVLLIGNGCKWKKCEFCNYYLDKENDENKQFEINKKVLDMVTGKYGKLEAINSGSIFELNSKSKKLLLDTCLKKGIKTLIVESHYMYRRLVNDFREECDSIGIKLKVKGGMETFDEHLREDIMKKGFGYTSLEDFKKTFDQINLLVGVKGQNIEQVEKDIEIGLDNFERICVNLYKEMDDIMPQDENVKKLFMDNLYNKYKDNDRIDILIENTDFGVGD